MELETFKTQIKSLTIEAMKQKNQLRVDTLRSITNAILVIEKNGQNKEINHMDVLTSLAKARNASIDAYTLANNEELTNKEKQELAIIEEFLPKTLTEDEMTDVVNMIIESFDVAPNKNQMGIVLNKFKAMHPGQDMRKVSEIVKSKLN